MRVLCYGGSFNPIHHGHLVVAQAVAEAAGFNRVLLIPSAHPPHKRAHKDLATAQDRLTMCQLAVQGVTAFAVSDVELRRPEPSYTLKTVQQLRAEGWDDPHWLIGGDTVPQLSQWYEPLRLLAEVRLLVAARPGCVIDWETLAEPYRSLRQNLVEAPLIDISSTAVRRRVAAGFGASFLVPPAVAEFIESKGLYRGQVDVTEG